VAADLDEFLFGQPNLFVIPIESLSERGMAPELANRVAARGEVDEAWCARFDEAFATAHARLRELSTWASDTWLPPRLQHVCVVTRPLDTRPLFLPLPGCSWLVYADDFGPATTDGVELGAFSLVLAERLAATRDLPRAVAETLGYWLPRTDAEVAAFVADARRATRPDAAALSVLADAMPTVRSLYHETLRRPPALVDAPLQRVQAAGVLAPPSVGPRLRRLVDEVREAAEATAREHLRRQAAGRARPDALLDWLSSTAPHLLVVDAAGAAFWDTDRPGDTDALAEALGEPGTAPAASMQADLGTIATLSADILGALADPEALPPPSDLVDQEDGVYLHQGRRAIAYALRHPGLDPRQEAAPPFHRWLLQARVAHEWGHLLEEVGQLGIRPDARAEHTRALDGIATAFEALVAAGPKGLRTSVEQQPAARGYAGTPGQLVGQLVLSRMSDYLANLFARRFVSTAAMQSYLRTNVPAHIAGGLDPLSLVARHAYEYQYLVLAELDDPWSYFLRSTWVEPLYVGSGIFDASALRDVFAATGRLCATYGVDPSAFG
jgi:hypothetical protein